MSIVLVGYRGSGKSIVGRILARRLGWELVDTDSLITAEAGMPIARIFSERGEPAFRDIEASVLAVVIGRPSAVISTGGGIIMREENRKLIKGSKLPVAYLSGSPAVLYKRISRDRDTAHNRPNLTAAGGLEEVQNLLATRDPLYREVATLIVDCDRERPDHIARRIARSCGLAANPA